MVVIQGARQVGKSTLARVTLGAPNRATWVTLDDPATLAIAERDPVFFVEQAGESCLVIDEAQRAPGLILPLKAAVDRDRRPGRFVLTGSADLLHVKDIADSLAGRAETIELMPLSQGELRQRETPEDFVAWLLAGPSRQPFTALDPSAIIQGGFPEPLKRPPHRARRWFTSYAERLSEHDARDLQQGGFADHIGALLARLAAGGQQELVKAKLARSLDIDEKTVDAYLRLATMMRLVALLPGWGRTVRSQAVRRPKVSLIDTGLAASLVAFTMEKAMSLGGREYYGALVEQFVALELAKQQGWSAESFTLHHFRDPAGLEVDLVIELADGRVIAVEVKSGRSVTEKSWAGLVRFRAAFGDREIIGVCLHGGTQVGRIDGWLHVLPITSLWEH